MKYKLAILVFSTICLSDVTVDFIPFGKSIYLLSNCFWLSEIHNFKKHIVKIKSTLVFRLMIMMIVSTIILAVFSPHYHSIYDFIRLLIFELFGKYFAIVYSFICISFSKDLRPIERIIYIGLILITLVGVSNYLAKQSFWINTLYPEGHGAIGADAYMYSDRFRVQSTFLNPFCYGYICLMLNLIFLYFYKIKRIKQNTFCIYMLMSIFGIFYCGCRTVILVWLLGVFVFYINFISRKNFLKYLSVFVLSSIIIGILIVTTFPNLIESFIMALNTDTSSGGHGMGGSSIGMRLVQLAAVFSYLPGYWLFGRGKDFFGIDLGFSDPDNLSSLINEGLWGLEGVYLSLLLERGIVGFLFWIIFYSSLIRYFYKKMNRYREESSLALSILISFVAYAMMTGELDSVYPTLLFLGIIWRIVNLKRHVVINKI